MQQLFMLLCLLGFSIQMAKSDEIGSVQQIDATHFKIGEITFDTSTREVRFPARVNMTEGLLEYVIVHERGKLHESLLMTAISPKNLNLALTLLRYTPSLESATEESKAKAKVNLEVEWADKDRVQRVQINDWVQHQVKASAMPRGPWVYGGSFFEQENFLAEATGDIAAIIIAPSALFQYPGEDKELDTVWLPYTQRVPPTGTPVTVIISPFQLLKP